MSANSPAESIFDDARRLADPAERRAYLDRACDGNLELRARIDRLLSAYDDGEFLESPPAMLAAAAVLPIGEQPGDAIGPYKLLEQIGEGGMGLVFVAEQTRPLRRRVALKIIKPGLDTRAVIARFEAERQALALMDHPNIAKIYDAGTTGEMRRAEVGRRKAGGGRGNTESSPSDSDIPPSEFPRPHSIGRPYFVMELVRGVPITDYCRDRQLDLRQRLELFIDVCHAVQHAHQKGVIHRDLKPTNILVSQGDTSPVPKVIDFGVAKATTQPLAEQTVYTAFSQIIGTPLYMSPEQADLGNQDVDTRSDVYSLGVVLYELLTDTTPFDAERLKSAGHDEMRRIIREEEPPKPSTRATTMAAATTVESPHDRKQADAHATALKGDLDWIVMKALEKDRRRRYESPSELAADIGRFLDEQPVSACPPSIRYRAGKFIRRHRAAAVVVALSIVSLAGMTAFLIFGSVRIARERSIAIAASRHASALKELAQNMMGFWVARSDLEVAVQLARQGRREEALNVFNGGQQRIREYNQAYADLREATAYADEEHLRLLLSLRDNCQSLYDVGMVDESTAILREVLAELRKYDDAVAKSIDLLTAHAWILVIWPDPALRNGPEALSLAQKAMLLDLEPGHWLQWFRWGVLAYSHLRCGNWQSAIDAIQKSDEIRIADEVPEGSLDCMLLALANWKLGNQEEARAWFAKGAMQNDIQVFTERHFAREVAEVLGMPAPP